MITNALVRRATVGACLVAFALTAQASTAQSIAGKWEGTLFAQGQSIPVVITLDSTANGWGGTLLVAMLRPDPIVMSSVSVKKDTVSIQLPEDGMSAFFQGLLTADRKTLNGFVAVQGDNSGTFQVTKAASAKAPDAPAAKPPTTPAKPPLSPSLALGNSTEK